jgi:hypothetical protein
VSWEPLQLQRPYLEELPRHFSSEQEPEDMQLKEEDKPTSLFPFY